MNFPKLAGIAACSLILAACGSSDSDSSSGSGDGSGSGGSNVRRTYEKLELAAHELARIMRGQVGELEPVAAMDAEGMRQLQYIVFAALANVLQHARAVEFG